MRKLRMAEHISLDGVIQPGGPNEDSEYAHGGWMTPYRRAAGAELVAEAWGKGFDLLLGRRTYDLWAGFWPTVKGGLFADSLNAATKYVATHRPNSLGWGPAVDLGADVLGSVRRVQSQDGPDLLVCGSATLTSLLIEHGLVDEVVLVVYPILLGRGIRCFPDSAGPSEFALVSSKATASGVLINTYRHSASVPSEGT